MGSVSTEARSKAVPPARESEGIDPELLSLPDPPRGERRLTLVLLAATVVAALAMIVALSSEARYALSDAGPTDLGDLGRVDDASLASNTFVDAHGMLGAAGAIRYERPLAPGSFRLMPVAGRADRFVEVWIPAGQETVRYIPPERFVGRLVRLRDAGPRHRGLVDAVGAVTHLDVDQNAWVIVDGQRPSDARWSIVLIGVCLALVGWSARAFFRVVRPAR